MSTIKRVNGILFWSFLGIVCGAIVYQVLIAPIAAVIRWAF